MLLMPFTNLVIYPRLVVLLNFLVRFLLFFIIVVLISYSLSKDGINQLFHALKRLKSMLFCAGIHFFVKTLTVLLT